MQPQESYAHTPVPQPISSPLRLPSWYIQCVIGLLGDALSYFANNVLGGGVYSIIWTIIGFAIDGLALVVLVHQVIFWYRYGGSSRLLRMELWLLAASVIGTLAVALLTDISSAVQYQTFDKMQYGIDFWSTAVVFLTFVQIFAIGNWIYLSRKIVGKSLSNALHILGFVIYIFMWIAMAVFWFLLYLVISVAHDPSAE